MGENEGYTHTHYGLPEAINFYLRRISGETPHFAGSEPLPTTQLSHYQLSSNRGLRTGNSVAELQSTAD
ncbi:hypothetical protein J6590_083614 [Homalodisca vitripennis]|nr:hypothetical protein J6590_083614 [Homalodisca vitripennis]